MTLLDPHILLFLALIALFTGFIKAGIPALGALLSALVALVFPPREALGLTLMYLLIGDTVAVSLYWRQAHWEELRRMVLPVLVGIVAGGWLLVVLDNRSLGLVIGVMVLVLVAMEPVRPWLTRQALQQPRVARSVSGVLAGVATTIGNAAGPILSIYFLVLRLDKRAFIGTGSIFFLCVNLSKIPIFLPQGMFNAAHLPSVALTAPLVFLGALGGRWFIARLTQQWFNRTVLALTAVAGVWLVLANLP